MLKARRVLDDLLPSSVLSFSVKVQNVRWMLAADVYSFFTFEPLVSLHLGSSNLLKNCTVSYVGCTTLCTNDGEIPRGRKASGSLKGLWGKCATCFFCRLRKVSYNTITCGPYPR